MQKKMGFWFARVLFFKSEPGLGNGIECSSHKYMTCKSCGPIHMYNIAFVQWYKILDENEPCVGEFDKTVGCIRL